MDSPKVENLFTENEVLKLLGVTEEALGRLRNEEGLPYIAVHKTSRMYLEQDLMRWLLGRRQNLGKDAGIDEPE